MESGLENDRITEAGLADVSAETVQEVGSTAFELFAQTSEEGVPGFSEAQGDSMGLTRIPGGQTVPDN